MAAMAAGSVNTGWKYGTGSNLASRSASYSCATIGDEARLYPASIDVLRWLFDHNPATLRAPRRAGTTSRTRHDKAALRELLRFGVLAVD